MFAAGLALRRIERLSGDADNTLPKIDDAAVVGRRDDEAQGAGELEHAPAYMAEAVLSFSQQLERTGTVGIVLLVGGMLTARYLSVDALWFVPLLFLVIRPISVAVGLLGTQAGAVRTGLMSWFGVRGIGSVYYLMYAVEHGLPHDVATRLAALVLTTVAVSVLVHGITVTPLMKLYSRWTRRPRGRWVSRAGNDGGR